ALTNIMDESSTILANALTKGNGGKVILWADETTIFNGSIEAKGGVLSGDGGFVETSGKEGLGVQTGRVDTVSFNGNTGTWLLDPATITITSVGSGTLTGAGTCLDTTTNLTISAATINAASSNVTLCASTSITQNAGQAINISASGIGITFQGQGGTITTTLNDNITTNGGAVSFINSIITLGSNVVIATGAGNITFNNTVNGVKALTVNSSGTKTFSGSVGGTTPLTSLTSLGAGTLSLQSVTTSGAQTYNFDAITLNGNYITTNSAFSANATSGSVTLGGTTSIATGSGSISFGSTVNGTQNLTFNASGGSVTLTGAVGGVSPLLSLAVTAQTITQLSSVTTISTMGVSYTGGGSSPTLSLGGNITTAGGSITTSGIAVTLIADSTLDTTNNGGFPSGANISFSNSAATIGGVFNLTLKAGSTGALTLAGAISGLGSSASTDSLTISSTATNNINFPAISMIGGLNMAGFNASFGFTTTIGGRILAQNVTTTGAINVAFNDAGSQGSSITGFASFNNTGTLTFGSVSGAITTFTNALSTGFASSVRTAGSIRTSAQTISLSNLVLIGATTIDSTNNGNAPPGANISFPTTIGGAFDLTLKAGIFGNLTFTGAISGLGSSSSTDSLT
ncbi:MAG: hypothetical protein JSS09_05420, partial [Verrucomicrobia bacterium]|nr:hypothetical protein [Verrucomicrobiota bacterium]